MRESPMKFRIRYQRRGRHVHCDVFLGHPGEAFVCAGKLCVLEGEEFEALCRVFRKSEFIVRRNVKVAVPAPEAATKGLL